MCRRVAISFLCGLWHVFWFLLRESITFANETRWFSNEARWFSNEASQYGPIEKNDKNGKTGSYQGDSL